MTSVSMVVQNCSKLHVLHTPATIACCSLISSSRPASCEHILPCQTSQI